MAQTLLGFDFGTLRIGVAVGNTVAGSADPLAVVATEPVAERWNEIARLIEHWQPQRLVVGRPRAHRNGKDDPAPLGGTSPSEPSEPELARRCERFARQLAGRFALPVDLVDEGYSSFEASATLAATPGRRRVRGKSDAPDDAEAAATILRQYLSNLSVEPLTAPPQEMTNPDAEAIYERLLQALREGVAGRDISLIGIHSGGAWIAERLHRDLRLARPLGTLSSAFHRDDYGRRGLPREMKATALPFEVDGADIVLVDDILFTGRTVRAAMNELFDYGRPARIELAVLLDRGGRELPIEARYCGAVQRLAGPRNYAFARDSEGRFSLRIE